jgi:predicted acyl esterase
VPLPSLPTATDPHTTSLLGIFNGSPTLTDLTLVEPLGLSYTTEPFTSDVVAVGPASLEVLVTSTSPGTDLYAVVSDVSPDGVAHPVATGRLRTAYPTIDLARSLVDDAGNVVQPYGDFSAKTPPPPGTEQRYHVELWPIGNRFEAGHRLRLHLVGASAYHAPTAPGANLVRVGGADGSRLLLPVAPADAVTSQSAAPAIVVAAGALTPRATQLPGRLPATGGTNAPAAVGALLVIAALATRRAAHGRAPSRCRT